MPLISLSSGKCIFIDLDLYLELEEADFEYMLATNMGFEVDNFKIGSILTKNSKEDFTDEFMELPWEENGEDIEIEPDI